MKAAMWAVRRRRVRRALMSFGEAVEAFGHAGVTERRTSEVALSSIVGSMARTEDFDADFHLLNPALRPRWDSLARNPASGGLGRPLELVQLGELFFVRDGHHRVSVALSLGWDSLPARITRVCTIAYAMSCLRAAQLPSKAAERRFLELVPLPDGVRRDLWLDHPAEWSRLAESVEAWARRTAGHGSVLPIGRDLASAWWDREVSPLVSGLRRKGVGLAMRDVQLYANALPSVTGPA